MKKERSVTLTREARRTWLPRGFQVTVCGALELFHEEYELSRFAELALRTFTQLLPQTVCHFLPDVLLNTKGRESGVSSFNSEILEEPDELIFLRGAIFPGEHGDHIDDLPAALPFTLRRISRFKEFPTSRTIAYEVTEERSSSLPSLLEIPDIPRLVALRLEEFRFGFSFFRPQFTVSALGVSPAVNTTIACDASPTSVKWMVSGEGLSAPNEELLGENDVVRSLDDLMKGCFAISLIKEGNARF